MARKRLLIFPFNGNGIEALDCINDTEYEFIGFVDDDETKLKAKNAYPVFPRGILDKHNDAFVLAVPGSPSSYLRRQDHIGALEINSERFISIIHPNVSLGKSVRIGTNCLIMSGVVLTSNATVGNHVCILPNTVVHHDVKVNDYSLIGSNVVIAGGTIIGKNCYIGSGTNIINGISIGDYSLVGMGSNIIRSVEGYSKIAGNPGRLIK